MRILDSEQNVASIETVGLSENHLAIIREAITKPYGLILLTGPTGSGKSTTLYSMLKELDRDKMNVISLEDPVEYHIDGISQSQVRPEIGYTFASGLRSVLRQDPDIIMVGEIRDKETAQLAVQAALTGHLVFSTLHTNNAPGAVPRLVDMGVDPYLIAPTLELVIAQRLVRKICPEGGRKIPIAGGLKKMLDEQFRDLPEQFRAQIPQSDHMLGIQPSDTCPSGTRGRTAVFELMQVTDAMEQTILESSDETVTYKRAREDGMLTMKEDAIIKALKGEIPFEEINTLGGEVLEEEARVEETEDEIKAPVTSAPQDAPAPEETIL
jgi:type II secretory ATPase GspE/PulE/Tfp pilus assembly ATPase PilB-like protein